MKTESADDLMPVAGRRSFLGVADLSDAEVRDLMLRAEEFRALGLAGAPKVLHGRSLVTLFHENSTRTRLSFEQAAGALGARVSVVDVATSSLKKGESLRDTVVTLENLGFDAIALRHPGEGVPHQIAEWTTMCVLNGGDGCHEHPTQALADIATLARSRGGVDRLEGLRIAFVGDVLHSRVARSTALLLRRFGAEIRFVGPSAFLPSDARSLPGTYSSDLDEEMRGIDVLYMLRVQFERLGEGMVLDRERYISLFQLNRQRANALASDAVILHAGPANVGVEIDLHVSSDARMLATEQVCNGLFMRMALLELLLAKSVAA